MRKCYISKNYKGVSSAGNKAKTDIEASLQAEGFINLGLSQTLHSNLALDYLTTLTGVTKASISIKKNDVIILQYPWKKYYQTICKIANKKGAKTITIIHDLGSFRRQKLTIEQEIGRLNKTNCIIAHNDSMKKWLIEQGITCPITCLEIFDYLSDSNAKEKTTTATPYRIAYAGALSPKKNKFIYDLLGTELPYIMELFGSGFDNKSHQINANLNFHGFTPSETLISTIKAHFGLVWDGESTEECSGTYGLYLRYNNPHKTSLYLRSYLPVIVWSESALAPFVQKHNIGLVINSLTNLPQILRELTPTEYETIKKNAIKVGKQIASGHYVITAVNKAIDQL